MTTPIPIAARMERYQTISAAGIETSFPKMAENPQRKTMK
jgi:hypothetical protein